MAVQPALNLRVSDRLLDDGLITQADHRRAVDYARSRGFRIEEALLELDVIDEVELLRYLAKLHRTQFVSTDRMSKAKLDRAALRMVPKKLAELYGLFPLLFDAKTQRLVVATADPDNLSAHDDLKAATRAQEIRPLVARPAAVTAAIARGYDGDKYAFSNLLRQVDSYGGLQLGDPFDGRGPAPARSPGGGTPEPPGAGRGAPQESPFRGRGAPAVPRRQAPSQQVDIEPGPPGRPDPRPVPPKPRPHRADPRREPTPAERPVVPRQPPRASAPRPTPAARTPVRTPVKRPGELSDTMRSVGDDELVGAPKAAAAQPAAAEVAAAAPKDAGLLDDPFAGDLGLEDLAAPKPAAKPKTPATPPPPPVEEDEAKQAAKQTPSLPPPPSRLNVGRISRRSDRPPPLSSQPGFGQLIEVLRVMVGLLENERKDLRGHSSIVARLVQDACERIGLSGGHTAALVVAAHLHDLGKRGGSEATSSGSMHVTALNVRHQKSIRELARKVVGLPEQLLEGVGLPEQTKTALRTMYEHVDGGGMPHGMPGNDIPIGGRILAVADAYADLTHNPSNTYDKLLKPERAMEVLREHAGTVFDQNIVEVFGHAMTGEKILGQLLDEKHRVLIVDPDPEQTLVLQLRLSDQGFEVHLARNTKEATAALEARKFALVVSEVDIEEPDAGLFLREQVAKSDRGKGLSWVFLSGRNSRNTLKRAFDMGVDDFISKPASVEIVVAKLVNLVEREEPNKPAAAQRGVSGSLSDMAMTDIVQILFHGQRTCALQIEWPDVKGEVHFRDGRIVQCILGDLDGENAFYRMLSLGEDGQFQVDPQFVPEGEPKIQASPEGLLLEGMRLLDEGLVP